MWLDEITGEKNKWDRKKIYLYIFVMKKGIDE